MLAQDVDSLVDFSVGHFGVRLFDFLAGQFADHDLRVYLEGSGELEGLGIAFGRFETRVAGYAQFLLNGSLVEALLNLLAQHFFTHLGAVVGFDDLGRSLARAETLDLGGARYALQAVGHLGVDSSQRQCNAHATLQAAQRFQLYLHVQSLDSKGVGL